MEFLDDLGDKGIRAPCGDALRDGAAWGAFEVDQIDPDVGARDVACALVAVAPFVALGDLPARELSVALP